jgi:hypothetical protein
VLGEWDFRAAPAFTWAPDHVWQLEVQLPLLEPVDWKIVQAIEGNNDWCEWQSGENTIIDPMSLELGSGDVLEVGCCWDGPARATIVETGGSSNNSTVEEPKLITVTEEAVYVTDEAMDDGDASTSTMVDNDVDPSTIASIAHIVSTVPKKETETEEQNAPTPQPEGEETVQNPPVSDQSLVGSGAAGQEQPEQPTSEATAARTVAEPRVVAQPNAVVEPKAVAEPKAMEEPRVVAQPEAVAESKAVTQPRAAAEPAPAGKAEPSAKVIDAPAEKPLPVSPWDSQPAQAAAPPATITGEEKAEADKAVSPKAAAPLEAAAPAAQESTEEATESKAPRTVEDVLKEFQASGTGAVPCRHWPLYERRPVLTH